MKFVIGTKADLENLVDNEHLANFGAVHRCENAFLLSSKTGMDYLTGLQNHLSIYTRKLICGHFQVNENDIIAVAVFIDAL